MKKIGLEFVKQVLIFLSGAMLGFTIKDPRVLGLSVMAVMILILGSRLER